jgi:DNA-binding transcriptional ArsR family regulator
MPVEEVNEGRREIISMTIEADEILEMPAVEELELAHVLQALSDPVRLQIVRELAAGGEQACGAMPLGVSASTRSHHFKILREAGLTVTRLHGTQRLVTLRRADVDRRFPGLLAAVLAER